MANTTVKELLAPYAEYIEANRGTVAAAMIYAEAKHVCTIRAEQGEPVGGWKNQLPLEHVTPVGFFFKSCRTGDRSYIRAQSSNRESISDDSRLLYEVLTNVHSVFTTPDEYGLSTEELIKYAASCLDMPLTNEPGDMGDYTPVEFVD